MIDTRKTSADIRQARRNSKRCYSWNDNEFNKLFIKEIYDKCRRMSLITGVAHQVDHIIPIQHSNVCGLHYYKNLQILTAYDNQLKNNSFSI